MTLDRLPRLLLRLEGLAVAAAALALYVDGDHSLLLLAALALAPDLALLAYAAGPRAGAFAYDAAHTEVGPLVLGVAGVLADAGAAQAVALVWAAHIGVDRLVGYGLKYPGAPRPTHMQRV